MTGWMVDRDANGRTNDGAVVRGSWSITRAPAPGYPGDTIVYLLFRKKTSATGTRETEIVDRRAVAMDDSEGRRMAVDELKARAEQ